MAIASSLPGEFDLIRRYFAPLAAANPGALGLSDDAALMTPPAGRQLVLTTDTIVAGIHYPEGEAAGEVARRLLRVNLSDLAAMGARPEGYLLNIALPRGTDVAWVAEFAVGLAEDQVRYGILLLGGDTVSTRGPTTLTLTAVGSVPDGTALKRSGARPGDLIAYLWHDRRRHFRSLGCSGPPAGRRRSRGSARPQGSVSPTRNRGSVWDRRWPAAASRPPPPTCRTGCSPISVTSARRPASERGSMLPAVPLSPEGRRVAGNDEQLLLAAMTGGDDYELVFTAHPDNTKELDGIAAALGVGITAVGHVEASVGVRVTGAAGQLLAVERLGFQHS